MGGVRHALGAAGYDNGGIACDDGLSTQDDRLEAGSADFVHSGANDRLREAGMDGALPRRSLTETAYWSETGIVGTSQPESCLLGGEDIAKEDLFDILGLDLGDLLNRSCARGNFVSRSTR